MLLKLMFLFFVFLMDGILGGGLWLAKTGCQLLCYGGGGIAAMIIQMLFLHICILSLPFCVTLRVVRDVLRV